MDTDKTRTRESADLVSGGVICGRLLPHGEVEQLCILNRPRISFLRRACCIHRWNQVSEHEAFTLDDFAPGDRNIACEHRPGVRERVKLAVFTARIDVRRQFAKKLRVETATGEFAIQLARIDASKKCE